MYRLASVEVALVGQWLEQRSLLHLARCSRRLLRDCSQVLAWMHCPLRIDTTQVGMEHTFAQRLSTSIVSHASVHLRVRLVSAATVQLLSALPAHLRVTHVELVGPISQHDQQYLLPLLHAPCMQHVRVLDARQQHPALPPNSLQHMPHLHTLALHHASMPALASVRAALLDVTLMDVPASDLQLLSHYSDYTRLQRLSLHASSHSGWSVEQLANCLSSNSMANLRELRLHDLSAPASDANTAKVEQQQWKRAFTALPQLQRLHVAHCHGVDALLMGATHASNLLYLHITAPSRSKCCNNECNMASEGVVAVLQRALPSLHCHKTSAPVRGPCSGGMWVPLLVRLAGVGDARFDGRLGSAGAANFAGTRGQSRALEGIQVLTDVPAAALPQGVTIRYSIHQNGVFANADNTTYEQGQLACTQGVGRRVLTGLTAWLDGPNAAHWCLRYFAHEANVGDTPVHEAGTQVGSGNALEGISMWLEPSPFLSTNSEQASGPAAGFQAAMARSVWVPLLVHLSCMGDTRFDGAGTAGFAGTRGQGRGLKGVQVLTDAPAAPLPVGVQLRYAVRSQGGKGAQELVAHAQGEFAGSRGQRRALTGFTAWMVGPNAAHWCLRYYVHEANVGDSAVHEAGQQCGTGNALEGIAMWLQPAQAGVR